MFATRLILTLMCLVALFTLVQADTSPSPSGFLQRRHRSSRRCGRQRKGNARHRQAVLDGSAGSVSDANSTDVQQAWSSSDVAQATASGSDAAQATASASEAAQSASSPESAAAPTGSGSGSSSSGGAANGQKYDGEGTYYDVAGMPSCGPNFGQYGNGDKVAAASAALMAQFGSGNPNNNPLCGRKLRATHEGKSTEVTIIDTCPPCTVGSVDFSPAAFNDLADQAKGRIKIEWSFI